MKPLSVSLQENTLENQSSIVNWITFHAESKVTGFAFKDWETIGNIITTIATHVRGRLVLFHTNKCEIVWVIFNFNIVSPKLHV